TGCAGPSGCIDHEEQFQQVVCRGEGRLYDEHFVPADRLADVGRHFSVTESLILHLTQRLTVGLGNALCQVNRRTSTKNFNSHDTYDPGRSTRQAKFLLIYYQYKKNP